MKCLSINLWNINDPLDLRTYRLYSYIKNVLPDIICCQEVSYCANCLQIQFLKDILGYNIVYFKSGYWNGREEGLAIATKYKILSCNKIELPKTGSFNDMQRLVIIAKIKTEKEIVSVLNTHLSYHKESITARESQALTLKCIIDKLNSKNIILCGDFNCFKNENHDFNSLIEMKMLPLYNTRKHSEKSMCTFSERNEFCSKELWPNRNIDHIYSSINGTFLSSICMNYDDGYLPCSDHFGVIAEGRFN